MKNEIVLYQSNELPERIEVRIDDETVWLSLKQIAQLFNRDKSVIAKHLQNILNDGELVFEATVAKYATVQNAISLQIQSKDIPNQGVFFDGQVFDAYELSSRIIRSAKSSIVLIDNYIDERTLTQLAKKNKHVKVLLLAKTITKQLALDVKKANDYATKQMGVANCDTHLFL